MDTTPDTTTTNIPAAAQTEPIPPVTPREKPLNVPLLAMQRIESASSGQLGRIEGATDKMWVALVVVAVLLFVLSLELGVLIGHFL